MENFSFCQSGKFPIRYNFYSEPDVRLILTLRGHPGVFGGGAVSTYLINYMWYIINTNFYFQNLSTKLVQSHGKLHLGEIVQENRYCDPIFTLLNPEGFRTLSIQGPEDGNCWGVTKDAEFNLCQHHMDETETEKVVVIGKLRRNYKVKLSDFTKSTLDNMDIGTRCKWSVEFPKDLDPVLKAIVLSGLFLMVHHTRKNATYCKIKLLQFFAGVTILLKIFS